MGSIWFSKKAFLYFGGAAIILLGGLIVVMAPYHYISFVVSENQSRYFEVYDQPSYYPEVELFVSIRYSNQTIIFVDISFTNNITYDTTAVNFTLTEDDQKSGPDNAIFYEASIDVEIPPGNYTVRIDRIEGAGMIDFSINQMSDSRLFIISGGSLNIIGLIMIIAGYILPGTFIPSDSDIIVSWGYDEEDSQDTSQ